MQYNEKVHRAASALFRGKYPDLLTWRSLSADEQNEARHIAYTMANRHMDWVLGRTRSHLDPRNEQRSLWKRIQDDTVFFNYKIGLVIAVCGGIALLQSAVVDRYMLGVGIGLLVGNVIWNELHK